MRCGKSDYILQMPESLRLYTGNKSLNSALRRLNPHIASSFVQSRCRILACITLPRLYPCYCFAAARASSFSFSNLRFSSMTMRFKASFDGITLVYCFTKMRFFSESGVNISTSA